MRHKLLGNNYFLAQKVEKITNSFVTLIKILAFQGKISSRKILLFLVLITTLQQVNSQAGSPTYQFMGGYTGTHVDAPGTVPAGLDVAIIPASVDPNQRLSSVTIGDLDNDGDLDFISGSQKGKLLYFKNTGTPTIPNWVLTPLATIDAIDIAPGTTSNEVRPELVDIDNDGDLDLLIGSRYSHAANLADPSSFDRLSEDVIQFINTGTKTNPIFTYTQLTLTGNVFGLHNNLGEFTNLDFVDIDNDNDLDLISQGSDSIAFAENIGTKFSPNFVRKYNSNNPFDNTLTGVTDSSSLVSQPEFVDLDKDGDLDMYYMQESGAFVWRENKGTAITPNFTGSTPQPMETELGTADIGAFGTIAFGDYNGDGVLDVLASNFNKGYFAWFKGLPQSPTLNTADASIVTSSSATLGGNVTVSTGSAVSEKGIVYAITATNSNPQISGTGVTQNVNSAGLGAFSKNFTGLIPNTQYSYAAYAINTGGTTYGTVKTFTTLEITPPVIQSINIKGTPVTNTTTIDFDVIFDEASTNVSVDDFSINGSGVTGTITAITGSVTNYTITVSSISGTGTLGINLKSNTDIIDALGNGNNNNAYVPAFTTGATHIVDTEAPTGYTISFDKASINSVNKSTVSFTFNNTEIGATYNYTFSSDGGGMNVTASNTIATAADQVSGIDLSVLNDGVITLSVTLTDINNNTGSITTATTTKDIILPTLTNSTPINNAIDISVDTNLELTFNENIKIGTGNIIIKKTTDDSIVTVADITDISQVSISNKVLTVNLTSNLATNTGFYVEIEPNAIKDLANNFFTGILGQTIFNFKTINKIPTTVVFNDFEKNYGANIVDLEADTNSTGTITYTLVGDAKGASINGNKLTLGNTGNIKVKISIAATATHTATSKEITITINKAILTVTANAGQTKLYGATDPILTYTITGFVNGDIETILDTPVNISRTTGENIGTYTITPSTATDTNYTVNFVTNSFEISKATLMITANPGQTKVYGTTDTVLTYTITGFVNGDTEAHLDTPVSISRVAGENTGTYTISPSRATDINYIVNFVTNPFEVSKATLTASADDKLKVFGKNNPGFTISYSGFLNSDTEADLDIAPIASSTATNSTPVGTISIDLSTGTDINYEIVNTNGTLTVVADSTRGITINKKYAFSPNGDGINDTWTIESINEYSNNTVKVFNRSGKIVFQQNAYKNTWNGVSNKIGSGKKLPAGPYLFIIELNEANKKPIQGWLYINY